MKPIPSPAPRRPLRFAAHVTDETVLQHELRAWLLRAINAEGSAAEVARKMNIHRSTVIRLQYGHLQFGLGTALGLSRAYPDA